MIVTTSCIYDIMSVIDDSLKIKVQNNGSVVSTNCL